MRTPTEIRRVGSPAELREIARLARVIWHRHYPGIITRAQIEYMLALGYAPEVMRRELARGVVYERALVDGRLAGFAAWGPPGVGRDLELHKLYVTAEHRRHGLARRLLERARTAAAGGGQRAVVLAVNKRNRPALRAYRRLGFRVREPVVREIGDGFLCNDYRMELPVPPRPARESRRETSSSTR